MKMDPKINKGLPRSPVKPPLPPKPKDISKHLPIHVCSESRCKIDKSISGTLEKSENDLSSEVVLRKRTSQFFVETTSNRSSLLSQSDEDLSTHDSSFITNQSIFYKSSAVTIRSSQTYNKYIRTLSHTGSESGPELFKDLSIHNNEEVGQLRVNDEKCNSIINSHLRNENSEADTVFDCTDNNDARLDCTDKADTVLDCSERTDSFSHFYDSMSVLLSDSTSDSIQNMSSPLDESEVDYKNNKTPKSNKTFLIAKELTTSEEVYVNVLRLLVIEFKGFLEEYGNSRNVSILLPYEVKKIFNTLPQLLNFHEDLLNDLKNRIENWPERKRIADVLVHKGPFLKLYTTYVKDFETQNKCIDEWCQKFPEFSKALREFETFPICKQLKLKDYMLKPVQRIPQYRLLLEDYLKHLDETSEEYHDTEVALNIVKNVLHHTNSSLKLADNFCKLLRIQSNLGNYEIIKPGRWFVKEGELKKLSRKEIQHRFIILLSDCLLYTIYTTPAIGMKVKYELPLSGMKILAHTGDVTDFSIITSTRSFTLRAKDEAECNEWVHTLQCTISENINRQLTFLNKTCTFPSNSNFESLKLGKEAPIWIPDKSASMCQICTAEFTVTFRRHHCRCCGKVVCGECSSNKAPLQYLKFQPQRVCEDCYTYLLEEFDDPNLNKYEMIKTELNLPDQELEVVIENIRSSFKKMDSVKKAKKYRPQRLKEVTANDSGSSMSGWLHRKHKKEWKRLWFVLKDQVLYMYKASQDVVALESLPVLGYVVDRPEEVEDIDASLVFRLSHAGQTPVVFLAPTKQLAELWVAALNEAIVLK